MIRLHEAHQTDEAVKGIRSHVQTAASIKVSQYHKTLVQLNSSLREHGEMEAQDTIKGLRIQRWQGQQGKTGNAANATAAKMKSMKAVRHPIFFLYNLFSLELEQKLAVRISAFQKLIPELASFTGNARISELSPLVRGSFVICTIDACCELAKGTQDLLLLLIIYPSSNAR